MYRIKCTLKSKPNVGGDIDVDSNVDSDGDTLKDGDGDSLKYDVDLNGDDEPSLEVELIK